MQHQGMDGPGVTWMHWLGMEMFQVLEQMQIQLQEVENC